MAAGIVLCGGRSSRMGQPKAWLDFHGEPLLSRIVRILSEQLSPIIVVAAVGQSLPPVNAIAAYDETPDRGPLHGLWAGLKCAEQQAESVYVTACDVPLLQPSFVKFIVDSLGLQDAAVPLVGGVPQPLAAAYRVDSILRLLPALVSNPRLGLRDIFPLVSTKYQEEATLRTVDANLDSLRNANTHEEWANLLAGSR
jgi:molybdenum cofactor guanylyltransferase